MRQLLKTAFFFAPLVLLTLAGANPATAHAFGARYDLPVPLSLYLIGAGAAVALSFVVATVFVRGETGAAERLSLKLPLHLVMSSGVRWAIKLASAALFVLIIAAGLIGDQDPYQNLAPTMVWIIWWVGMAYVSALFGNLWALVNPWRVLFEVVERLYGVLRPGARLGFGFAYPSWLGVWPACILFLAYAWAELVWPARAEPSSLAIIILAYSAITWGGMLLFGRTAWLGGGEAFSVAFGLIARFAPLQALGTHHLNLRLPATGLIAGKPAQPSRMIFVLLLLSTVTFDGFKETAVWIAIDNALAGGGEPGIWPVTLGLLVFPLLFMLLFLLTCRLMALAGGSGQSTVALAGLFVTSLVPIAIAYHLAHYLSFLLINGQLFIPLASDPFGFGWDLFGTAGYKADIAIVGAKFAWYTALAAIVVGHIIAVSLAHAVALKVHGDSWRAMRSQYPMLVLMVGYTIAGLWILSQPLV
ncbi:MAG: hypothetical protein HOM52_12260 [Rhodospirillaceae bacterium]|nr:hypothetical protein [Rhodospirillaceae bacterium]MBT5039277.1 hypothetical protein [Rhodospirillaceae bacterium]MBT7291253.1 hypothetical protein [Rhodospirillaceae bacterium]